MDEDLQRRLERLEKRITFIEDELDVSYDEYEFKSRISTHVPEDANIDVTVENFYKHAFIDGLDTNGLNAVLDWLKRTDYQYEVTETGGNLGVEVYDE